MDFNGNGRLDILSGSWPGEIYLFRREADGTFSAPAILEDREGRAINVGSASAVHAVDWDGNGLLDLLIGNIQGEVHLLLNEGTPESPAFGPAHRLEVNGQHIQVPGGDAGPFVADWDGDGRPDLIVGAGDGSVLWYRDTAESGPMVLSAAQTLVPPSASTGVDAGPAQPGRRAKVCVTDWNENGRLDLLVGDFALSPSKPPEPKNEEEADAEAQARARLDDLLGELRALQEPPPNESSEDRQERARRMEELRAEVMELLPQIRQPALVSYEYHGWVWLYLRQPVESEPAD